MVSQSGSVEFTIIGKTADLTVVQKTIIDWRVLSGRPVKSVGELHKEWTEAGVTASRATTHRRILDTGFKCRIPLVKLLLNNKHQRTGLLLSGPKSSFLMRANVASHLETKVPESGGRVERHTIQDA